MLNIFDNVKIYGGEWKVVSSNSFSKEDIEKTVSNEVVQSKFGLSVKFRFNNGEESYIALSRDSQLALGESLDMQEAKILILERGGESTMKIIER